MAASGRGGRLAGVRTSSPEALSPPEAQCSGRPCIRGLRTRVKDVLDLLAAGAEPTEILEDYPYLEPEDIRAVLEFAAAQTDHPVLHSA